jgi:hypothetical protein
MGCTGLDRRASSRQPGQPRPVQPEERGPTMETAIGVILILIALIEIFGIIRIVGKNAVG